MRRWHRWISLFLFFPMVFIAATGLLSHWAALWPESGVDAVPAAQAHEGEQHEQKAQAALTPATAEAPSSAATVTAEEFTCPEGWRCRPAPPESGPRAWTGFFHHLHSGEEFGVLGTAISILAGFGLLFFSLSGIWMYAQMWLQRRNRGAKDRWFWQ